ncbi:MAG: heavy metal-binding domain-containing protein [Candidatus Aminicenantales bacterium]
MLKHSKILVVLFAVSLFLTLSGFSLAQEEEMVVCPVSGKEIKKSEAKASYEYKGETYYFCCPSCKEKFTQDPDKYLKKKHEMMKEVYTCPMHPEVKSDKPGKCPKCGMNLEKKVMHAEHMEKKCEEKTCCFMVDFMKGKDVELSVKNIKKGVTIQITSEEKEMVEKVQEMAAKMKEMYEKKSESCEKKEKCEMKKSCERKEAKEKK